VQGHNLNQLSSILFDRLNKLYLDLKPRYVIVHGDTLTSVIASWSAFQLGIKVIHVEAGLRTHDVYSPFPEEFYRQVTSKITHIHFAPTERGRHNLLAEGIPDNIIHVTGNTVIDALKWGLSKISLGFTTDAISEIGQQVNPKSKLILVTAHRRENLNGVIRELCDALLKLVESHEDVQILLPVHLNIAVRTLIFEKLSGHPRILLTEPLDYPSFIHFMASAYFIMTDSGGIQEEATYLSKPVLVFRSTTERAEGVAAGNLLLTGLDSKAIFDTANRMLVDNEYYSKFVNHSFPFGNGTACDSIVFKLKALSFN
jgi:UDP-N-acetylglucosamine 2-epimerase (non-hydrolysing)